VYNAESKSGKRSPLENIRGGAESAVISAGRPVGTCAGGEGEAEEDDAEKYGVFFVHVFISIAEVVEM
jgi:hypothetical protein